MKKTIPTPQKYLSIHGWFDYEDLYLQVFQELASPAHIVEIGCWLGRSACYMAELIKAGGKEVKFDCIDTWLVGSEEHVHLNRLSLEPREDISDFFKDNMKKAGVLKQVNMVKTSSLKAVKKYKDASLDFVFLDDDHSEEHVFEELNAWWPKIKKGGILAGHDYSESNWPGVVSAVKRFTKAKRKKHKVMLHSYVITK
jgi:predicted O-methyltransferase YrrM